jgi:hypothetical protein
MKFLVSVTATQLENDPIVCTIPLIEFFGTGMGLISATVELLPGPIGVDDKLI